jgi:ATP-dependent Clp protease protease subunit
MRNDASSRDLYCTFGGPIDQDAIQRFFRSLPRLTERADARVHLLLQTVGGYVGDGICLYNLFRTFPRHLTVYNAGNISSIGVIAYLGARRRKATHDASFMMHRSTMHMELPTAERLQAAVKALQWDDARTEKILRRHVKMTGEGWRQLDRRDLTLSAADAVRVGLVHEIGDFAPPSGGRLLAIV